MISVSIDRFNFKNGVDFFACRIGMVEEKCPLGRLPDELSVFVNFVVGNPIVIMARSPREFDALLPKICSLTVCSRSLEN